MARIVTASVIPILPPQLSSDDQVRILQHHLHCTPTQGRVVLAGASDKTCAEIGRDLTMAESTVRAHYHAFFERTRCTGRNEATARVVALLWQAAAGSLTT